MRKLTPEILRSEFLVATSPLIERHKMDLALLVKYSDGSEEVVVTTHLGKVGSYRNVGIYGDPGFAMAALQEFQSAHPEATYRLCDARQVAHQNKETYKWEVFSEYSYLAREEALA